MDFTDRIEQDNILNVNESSNTDIIGQYLFIVSADNQDRLRKSVVSIIDRLENIQIKKDFSKLIYTLQIDSISLKQRLAINIIDKADLHKKLKQWLKDSCSITEAWFGQVNQQNLCYKA